MRGAFIVDEAIEARLAGVVVVKTLPAPSTATHRDVVGQDTPVIPVSDALLSTFDTDQANVPPFGLVEVTTLPTPSTATHRPVVGQEILFNRFVVSTFAWDQAEAPPVGLVEVTTSPVSSPATH
jgi:hypothetical protein